jgi:FAD-dependent oxidoreductase family protein
MRCKTAFVALLAAGTAAAARPADAAGRSKTPRTQTKSPAAVLDIEKLQVVRPGKYPNVIPTCDVLVVGGGLGGVAAAEALARQGITVILAEPTSWLGGQLTSQGVSLPDENSYIEREPGCGTQSYRLLREQFRARYAAAPGIRPGRAQSVGMAWVSRVSGEPAIWEAVIRERLESLKGAAGIREILTRSQLVQVQRFSQSGLYHYADFVNLDTGRITRVAAKYLLDASEMGDGIALAGLPWTVGAEARAEHGEAHAPEQRRPDWIQSFTYCFAVRWQPQGPHEIVPKPAEYEYFKSLGEYTLAYDYSDARGRVYYKVFEKVPGAGGPFWTYRRLIAASSFSGNPDYSQDVALINWRGNDFHDENPVGKAPEEQVRVLKHGKAFAQGFLHWLQTECPRDDGGFGYPEMQLAKEVMGTEDGFAMHPYVRESRRLLAEFTLTENHLAPDSSNPDKKWGEEFPDTVGIALYSMDIHPAKGEPPFLSRALPYHLPLGSFIPRAGARNVLPAAKNWGATRLALSSARMHPTEWLAGEVAGHLAAFCIRREVEPSAVRHTPALLSAFQAQLQAAGIPLRWSEIIR